MTMPVNTTWVATHLPQESATGLLNRELADFTGHATDKPLWAATHNHQESCSAIVNK